MSSIFATRRGARGGRVSCTYAVAHLERILNAVGRGLLIALVLVAGMPQARAATLLTWDITGSTGTSSGLAPSAPSSA